MHEVERVSVAALDARVHKLVESGQFGVALDEIRDFVEYVIFDQKSVAKVFSSPKLDELCRLVGQTAATTVKTYSDSHSNRTGTVVLATELVKAGGHVELLKDIIRLRLFDGPISIILTDLFVRVDQAVIADFSASSGVNVESADACSSNERLLWVIERLRDLAPATLVLLTHNQDSVGIAAAHSHAVDNVVFIHHGDHHLTLGVTCEDFVHIDPSNIGYFHCKNELGIKNNRYWPLTVNCHSVDARVPPFLEGGRLRTCSSGRPEKFDSRNYLYDYIELIPKLLAITGGSHIHIGGLTADMVERLQHGLLMAGVDPACFIHVEWVPSVAMALVEYKVDLYISSFPLGGGKACVEAMAAGIPLLMHQNYHSRFHGGEDLAYQNAWSWRTETELFGIINSVTAEDLKLHSLWARTYYEKFHSDQALIEAADLTKIQSVSDVPPLKAYIGDALQVFLDEAVEGRNLQGKNVAEIERINSEWLIAFKEIDRLNAELLISTEEIERVNHERSIVIQELESTNAELLATTAEDERLQIENANLLQRLGSPKALIKSLASLLLSRLH